MVKRLMDIGKTVLNISYHPILENYEDFEHVLEDEGQGKESNLSFYLLNGNHHFFQRDLKVNLFSF